MGNKNLQTKYLIISIVIVFITLMGISVFTSKENRNLNFVEKAFKDTFVFTQKVFQAPINFVKEKAELHQDKKKLYKKYVKLKEKVDKTELYYEQVKELQKEVTELKSMLELNSTLSEYTYVNATVVNRNIGYWYNTLTIDKGSKNGVKKGDAVIVTKGLVGKISSVSNFSSTVKLLTTNKISNKISIKIESEGTHLYGLLIGYDEKKKVYKIEGITNSNKVKEGASVTTTGLTDYFPSGILIGHVSKVVKDEYDLNSIVEVKPSVDFENISTVTVLNREAEEN